MSDDSFALILLLFGIAMLPALAVPLTRMVAAGEVGRNSAAGIRTRHTRASDAAWIAGHAAAPPRVSQTVPVAADNALVAAAATLWGGIDWSVGAGMTGSIKETAVLISATGPANTAARHGVASVTEDPTHHPVSQNES